MGKKIQLIASDGHRLDAYVAQPENAAKASLIICQEVMGVNEHIRDIVEGFAKLGYLAIAPAFFDRKQSGVELGYTDDDIVQGREIRNSLSWDETVMDVEAAFNFSKQQVNSVGIVGYCWGGSIAWLAACRLPLLAAVGYYGGQIHQHRQEKPICPTLLHFGDQDHLVSADHVKDLRALHPEVEIHVYSAGHGFSCNVRSEFEPKSAKTARERTLAFLNQHLS